MVLRRDEGHEARAELWRVLFAGCGQAHEQRARAWSVPRRCAVIRDNGRTRADYTSSRPTVYAREPFRIRVAPHPPP